MTGGNLPKVLVVSVPKAGTNLLMQVVLGIPGMVQTRQNMFALDGGGSIKPGEMGVMHLPYSYAVESILVKNRVKVIFIHRDLRDVAVSMMYFIATTFTSHVLYPSFQRLLADDAARLSAIINGVNFQKEWSDTVLANELYVACGGGHYPNIQEFWKPFMGWTQSDFVCQVTFEELATPSQERTAALLRIVDFLWGDLRHLGVPKSLIVSNMEQNINPSLSPTFRSGRVGDWKSTFTDQHKRDFKRIAGRTLIDFGYERDLNW